MNTALLPRLTTRLIKLPSSNAQRFSTSSILFKPSTPNTGTNAKSFPQTQSPPSTQPQPKEVPKQKTGTERASSVLFWIGGVGVIYAGWRLNERFWRGEVGPRV